MLTYVEALADRIVYILCDIVLYLSFSLMAVSCHKVTDLFIIWLAYYSKFSL